MVKCSFSGQEIPKGTGIMYVQNDGKVLYFINRKAEKNFLKLKRKPYNVKWTEESRRNKQNATQVQKVKESKEPQQKQKRKGDTAHCSPPLVMKIRLPTRCSDSLSIIIAYL